MELKSVQSNCDGTLVEWLVHVDDGVSAGSPLARVLPSGCSDPLIVYCNANGLLKMQCLCSGEVVKDGGDIAQIEVCSHPALFKNMCVSCGMKLAAAAVKKDSNSNAEVSHQAKLTLSGGQSMNVSNAEARRIEKAKIDALRKSRKLALVLDLDSTLLHATANTYSPEIMSKAQVLHMEDNGRKISYYVKFRPQLDHFLRDCNDMFQMTIYTHGNRAYAEAACRMMDPDGKYFGKRIVSRTDQPELGMDKSLARLFLADWSMAIVLDDREDVWRGEQQSHLLCIKPYIYFPPTKLSVGLGKSKDAKSTREINNAPGVSSFEQSKAVISEPIPSSSGSGESTEPPPLVAFDRMEEEEGRSLLRALEVLTRIHNEYYSQLDRCTDASEDSTSTIGHRDLSVGNILSAMRKQSLRGCVLCFSGLNISEPHPEKHILWQMASRLGAVVSTTLLSHTTHLLALSLETHKAHECMRRGNVYICHPDWLLHCHWHVCRENEEKFLLSSAPSLPVPMYEAPNIPDSTENLSSDNEISVTPSKKREREESSQRRTLLRSNAVKLPASDSSSCDSDSDDDIRRRKSRKIYHPPVDQIEDESSSSGDDDWLLDIERELDSAPANTS